MKKAMRIVGYVAAGLVLLALAAFGGLYYWISNPAEDPQTLPTALVSMATPEGSALLDASTAKADHDALKAAFQPQQKGSWCGVASAVIALRALEIAPDITQEGFFNDDATRIRSKLAVTFGGMNLDELGALLQAHGANVTVVHAADSDLASFRAAVAKNLATAEDVMIVNYLREHLGQGSMGHLSPIGAHDPDSDRVLILDTAAYKWPATWVPTKDLFEAMNTVDSANGKTRGYVAVTRP